MTPAPVFEFAGVTGGYGSSVVVRGLGGAVAPGEVLGVLGRNGVGKSTLLKLLHGFLPLRDGEIRHRGLDIRALAPAERSRRGITFAPQERIVFDDLSVRDNLWLMHPASTSRRSGTVLPALSSAAGASRTARRHAVRR